MSTDSKDQQFIKKAKLSYVKCPHGDLHEGELMTLVCVDVSCTQKGLICPVCRMNDHEKHKTIPLKIFLSQIYDKFSGQKKQNNQANLSNLSEYLRQLDSIRLELLTVLRDAVTQIADKVKKVQQQIIQNYSSIRKLVLTQSTISTRLPELVKMMMDTKDRDPKQVLEDFKKYTSLMVYDNQQISFLQSSKKIVDDYSELPNVVNLHLTTMIPSVTKILDSLPLSLDKPKKVGGKVDYTFDQTAKMQDLVLQQQNKQVSMNPQVQESGGYVLVKQGTGNQAQSISFRIVSTNTDSIRVGMVLPEILLKGTQYMMEQTDINHGLFCLSALGLSYQHNNPQMQDNQDTFLYGKDDVIDINWDPKTKKLNFSRRHAVEKATIDVNLQDHELQNLRFMVGIFGVEDIVSIVEPEQLT